MDFDSLKSDMQDSLEHLKKELAVLRTGRANPTILDGVFCEVYGTKMKLKEVAHVTTPEPRQIVVTPFDKNNINSVCKAISDDPKINFQPVIDGNIIRINIPPLDEGMRKDIVKQAKKLSENGKVSMREIRRRYNDILKKEKKKVFYLKMM